MPTSLIWIQRPTNLDDLVLGNIKARYSFGIKNSLNKFAFSKKLFTNWSLTTIGGINGILLLLTNDIRMDQ